MTECINKDMCKRNLEETENTFSRYGKVYICRNCKRYYIKINQRILEVCFDYKDGIWRVVGKNTF